MTGSRFEHSLGAMHLAQVGILPLWANTEVRVRTLFREALQADLIDSTPPGQTQAFPALVDPTLPEADFRHQVGLVVGAVALLHDVGHAPFSHALEKFYEDNIEWVMEDSTPHAEWIDLNNDPDLAERPFHERAGILIARKIREDLEDTLPWSAIESVLRSGNGRQTWSSALHDYVSGEVDIDRLDYLIRDSRKAGVKFDSFDYKRLIGSVALYAKEGDEISLDSGWVIGYDAKAIPALEDFLQSRYQYYRRVALHNKVFGYNLLLDVVARSLRKLTQDISTGAVVNHSGVARAEALNYLPLATASRANWGGDDASIVSWLRASLGLIEADRNPRGSENLDKVVIAGTVAMLDREANWVSLWKSDFEYMRICEELFRPLQSRVVNCAAAVDIHMKNHPDQSHVRRIGDSKLALINDSIRLPDTITADEGRTTDEVRRKSVGPAPLVNELARLLFKNSRADDWMSRPMQLADAMNKLCSERLRESGTFVTGYYSVSPTGTGFDDSRPTQVHENSKVVHLLERSRHFLERLSNVEAERPQMRWYFLFFAGSRMSLVDIRQEFIEQFPNLVESQLRKLMSLE